MANLYLSARYDNATHLDSDFLQFPEEEEGAGGESGGHPDENNEISAERGGGRAADGGITHLAFRWVTRVRSGQQTARNRSMEMADRVRMLEIMHKTETQSSVRISKQTNAENNQTRKSW